MISFKCFLIKKKKKSEEVGEWKGGLDVLVCA